jgi:hypothetical protein
MSAETIDLSRHLAEFKEKGYTIFPQLFDQDQISQWKQTYDQIREELFGNAVQKMYTIRDMVERSPRTTLAFTANRVTLDFLELVMGPFVQIGDANFNGFASDAKEAAANKVNGWHRDMFAFAPNGTDYQIPRQALALTYLEDMTEEYGPLRVIPGSHRKEVVINPADRNKPHPEEVVLSLKAGDVIVFSGILHTGTPNTSGRHRVFIGGMYTYSWYRPTCNFDGPNIQRLIKQAAERNDRRMLRLLGVNGQLEQDRINSGFLVPDESKWKEWIAEDQAALKGTADWWRAPLGN